VREKKRREKNGFSEQCHYSVNSTCQREPEPREPIPTRPLDTLDVCHPNLRYRVHSKDTLLLNAKLEEAPATNASHFMTSHNGGWSHEGKCLLVPQWRVSCLFGWWTTSVMRRTWLYWVRCSLGKNLNIIIVRTICCTKRLKVNGKFYMISLISAFFTVYIHIYGVDVELSSHDYYKQGHQLSARVNNAHEWKVNTHAQE
jgi:hypothetical protein